MGTFIVISTVNKHRMKLAIASLFAIIVVANASNGLDSIFESKEKAASNFLKPRARLGLDPDEWCVGTLKNPRCWRIFAKSLWKPVRIVGQNLVKRKEGRPLYWCTKWCKTGDWWKDFFGKAHEEKREKKEEYCETLGQTTECQLPEVGCAHCCEKIPKSLACLEKVKAACPDFYSDNCNQSRNSIADFEARINDAMGNENDDEE